MGDRLLLLVALLFLVSCTGQIIATPIGGVVAELNQTTQDVASSNKTTNITLNNQTVSSDPCAKINCGENQACKNGSCECLSSTKKCGNSCIKQEECCTDNECPKDKICFEHTCATNNCEYNEQLDKTTKTCQCTPETTWCETQSKCIPKNGCCTHSQCIRNEACVKYRVQVNICYNRPSLSCKRVVEGENITLNNQTVLFSDARQNSTLLLKTAEGVIKTQPQKNEQLGNGSIFVKEILSVGGVCVDDED